MKPQNPKTPKRSHLTVEFSTASSIVRTKPKTMAEILHAVGWLVKKPFREFARNRS